MDLKSNILITGAAGFIGSYLVGYLNKKGYENLILADEFDEEEKELNLHGKTYLVRVERDNLFEWLDKEQLPLDFVFHLGARTDTAETDYRVLEELNLEYSRKIWEYCILKKSPLVYASSAATYGQGEFGYKDDHASVEKLSPLNPYGISKNEFDKWALAQPVDKQPPFWVGLKFFNVYGPNEYHKGRMASVIFHAFNQIRSQGTAKLFRSHKPEYKDGEQLRDFIYVDDIAAVCTWFMEKTINKELTIDNGLYNLGTGKARTFKDLVCQIFTNLSLPIQIEYIDTPHDIRERYQYFTEADMSKLRKAGYQEDFFTLEKGIGDYARNFLMSNKYY